LVLLCGTICVVVACYHMHWALKDDAKSYARDCTAPAPAMAVPVTLVLLLLVLPPAAPLGIAAEAEKAGSRVTVEAETAKLTLSPEERMKQHELDYEKEFVVELDLGSHWNKQKPVGARLDVDTDFQPVTFMKIRKTGLLQQWNEAHPDKAVANGDEIIKINDIGWHHNSKAFGDHILGQIGAAARDLPGARKKMTLTIRRPRKQRQVRFQSQRDDMRRQAYEKEFATFHVSKEGYTMGWTLNKTKDWKPIIVAHINCTGYIADWNRANPQRRVVVGDELVHINRVGWHFNSEIFDGRVKAQLHVAEMNLGTNVSLNFRRPRPDSGEKFQFDNNEPAKQWPVCSDEAPKNQLGDEGAEMGAWD